MSNIVLVSYADGIARQWSDIAWPTFRNWANTHGVATMLKTSPVTDRPSSWEKIPLLLKALRDYETVMWIDADAVIVNALEPMPVLEDGVDMLIRTTTAALGEVPNCGVLILRSCPWTIDFLQRAFNQEQFIHGRWWEQAAILHLLGYKWDIGDDGVPTNCHMHKPTADYAHVGALPDKWNSMPFAVAKDAVVEHFAGTPDNEKFAALKEAAVRTQ